MILLAMGAILFGFRNRPSRTKRPAAVTRPDPTADHPAEAPATVQSRCSRTTTRAAGPGGSVKATLPRGQLPASTSGRAG